jgi:hypothetical protein
LAGIQIELWEGQLIGGGLAFDLPIYWSVPDRFLAALQTPLLVLPAFIWVEIWRFRTKKAVPFKAYAIYVIAFFVVFVLKFCVEITGVFVWLNTVLRIDESVFDYGMIVFWVTLIIVLPLWAAKVSARKLPLANLPTS